MKCYKWYKNNNSLVYFPLSRVRFSFALAYFSKYLKMYKVAQTHARDLSFALTQAHPHLYIFSVNCLTTHTVTLVSGTQVSRSVAKTHRDNQSHLPHRHFSPNLLSLSLHPTKKQNFWYRKSAGRELCEWEGKNEILI
jgi:hypothetical protein